MTRWLTAALAALVFLSGVGCAVTWQIDEGVIAAWFAVIGAYNAWAVVEHVERLGK